MAANPGVAHLRPVYEAVASVLDDAIVEPVQVGIFFKGTRNFAELRPKRDRKGRLRFELSVILLRRVEHRRVRRAMSWSGGWVHYVDLYAEADVDDAVRQWLAESFLSFAP